MEQEEIDFCSRILKTYQKRYQFKAKEIERKSQFVSSEQVPYEVTEEDLNNFPHVCNSKCDFTKVFDDMYFCNKTGNLHICNKRLCKFNSSNEGVFVCSLTGSVVGSSYLQEAFCDRAQNKARVVLDTVVDAFENEDDHASHSAINLHTHNTVLGEEASQPDYEEIESGVDLLHLAQWGKRSRVLQHITINKHKRKELLAITDECKKKKPKKRDAHLEKKQVDPIKQIDRFVDYQMKKEKETEEAKQLYPTQDLNTKKRKKNITGRDFHVLLSEIIGKYKASGVFKEYEIQQIHKNCKYLWEKTFVVYAEQQQSIANSIARATNAPVSSVFNSGLRSVGSFKSQADTVSHRQKKIKQQTWNNYSPFYHMLVVLQQMKTGLWIEPMYSQEIDSPAVISAVQPSSKYYHLLIPRVEAVAKNIPPVTKLNFFSSAKYTDHDKRFRNLISSFPFSHFFGSSA